MRRLSAEVSQGAPPSVDWGATEIDEYTMQCVAAMKESLVHNSLRKRWKRKFSTARVKVYENIRLMSLGRKASELDKIYDRLDDNLMERLDFIEQSTPNLDVLRAIKRPKREMKEIHGDFHDEVYMILSDHDASTEGECYGFKIGSDRARGKCL